jgi:hypothetical protein
VADIVTLAFEPSLDYEIEASKLSLYMDLENKN